MASMTLEPRAGQVWRPVRGNLAPRSIERVAECGGVAFVFYHHLRGGRVIGDLRGATVADFVGWVRRCGAEVVG